MPSSPSTIPSRPSEAKDRLREIVEAFFFRRRSDQGRPPAPQLLVRSPPGLGKTKEAMEWATRYQTEQQGKDSILELSRSDITLAGVWAQVAIFVLRHELAQEVKEVIQRNREDLGEPVVVPVLRGRDHEADKDNAPCRRWREACELGRKGLPVYSNLCRRRHQQDVSECPYFADCEYIPAWQSAHAAPYVIPVHAHLGVGWESSRTVRGAVGLSDSDDEEEPQFDQSFNPANAAIVVCDEDPTTSLIERSRIRREDIGAITESRLGEHILAGLSTLGGILDHLREKGITAEQLRDTANKLATQERRRGQIAKPSASDAVVGNAIKLASSLVRVSRVLERLADELASGRPGQAHSLVADGGGLIAQGRRPWPFDRRRLLVLDGTANTEILGQFVPSLGTVPEIRVRRNARVIQVSNMTFYRGSLNRRTSTREATSEGRLLAYSRAKLGATRMNGNVGHSGRGDAPANFDHGRRPRNGPLSSRNCDVFST